MKKSKPSTPKVLVFDPSYYTDRYSDELSTKSRQLALKAGLTVDFAPVLRTAKAKAAYLNKILAEQSYDYLWALSGGFQCIELLPYLKISKTHRTQIIGYSDINHIMLPYLKSGGRALYGPNFRNLAKYMTPTQAVKFVKELLARKCFDLSQATWITGPRIKNLKIDFGGTLAILIGLFDTRYVPSLKGQTLFVEHHYLPNEAPHDIEYWFQNLAVRLSEQKPKALIVGNLTYEKSDTRSAKAWQKTMLKKVFAGCGFSVALLSRDHRRELISMG